MIIQVRCLSLSFILSTLVTLSFIILLNTFVAPNIPYLLSIPKFT